MAVTLAVHLLAAVVWVGGMFFAHVALRPSASMLAVPERVRLWEAVLRRFMVWVWISVISLLVTGYWMIIVEYGGYEYAGTHVRVMHGVGWFMILLFFYVFFVLFRRMRRFISQHLFPEAGMVMERIRLVVTINLILGLLTSTIASAGRFW
ncbi:MAG: CopD family protein [Magnetococcales bacterium]|nr:CopD family protein [Magnetococcales bacterium]